MAQDTDHYQPPIMRGWRGKRNSPELEGVEKRLRAQIETEEAFSREAPLPEVSAPVTNGGSWGLLEDRILRLDKCFPAGGDSPFRGRLSGYSRTLDASVMRFFADADDGRRAMLYINQQAGTCMLSFIAAAMPAD